MSRAGCPRRLVLCSIVLASVTACASGRAIETPPDLPRPACADAGLAACEQACEANDGDACLAAASARERKGDRERMAALEQRACELGVARGCAYYANNLPWAATEQRATILEYDGKACDGGFAKSCAKLGWRHFRGEDDGSLPNAAEGLARLDRACELGEVDTCAGSADARWFGLGTAADPDAAHEGWTKACAQGNAAACHNAEHTSGELWLSLPLQAFGRVIDTSDPQLVLGDTIEPMVLTTKVLFCVEEGNAHPSRIEVLEPSTQADVDRALVETVSKWSFRVRDGATGGRPLCKIQVFKIQLGGRGLYDPSPGVG